MLFLADAYTIEHAGVVFGIGLDALKLEDVKVVKQLSHMVVETYLLNTTASVCQQYTLAQGTHDLRQFLNRVATKDESGWGYIIKILHGSYCYFCCSM